MIVQTAVTKSNNKEVVVFGEDTDLPVLLCHHAKQHKKAIYFTSDKHVTTKTHKIFYISNTKSVIGEEICYLVPFTHSTGCDTSSRLFGIGKQFPLSPIHIFRSKQRFSWLKICQSKQQSMLEKRSLSRCMVDFHWKDLNCVVGGSLHKKQCPSVV